MKIILPLFVVLALTVSACQSPSGKTDDKDSLSQVADSTAAAPTAVADKGVSIDYSDSKKGDTVLLFVHGWILNKSYWTAQEKHFGPRYRVVAITLPGFGTSGKNRDSWTAADFGRDVDSVISELDLHHVILVGHSMSVDIVLEAALHAKDRVIGVVGVDNFKGVGIKQTAAEARAETAAFKLMKQHFMPVADEYFTKYLFAKSTDSALRQRILQDIATADTAVAYAAITDGGIDEMKSLRVLHQPLYLINASYQPTDTTGLHKAQIPFHIIQIDNSGHFPMAEQPEAFNRALDETIRLIATKSPAME